MSDIRGEKEEYNFPFLRFLKSSRPPTFRIQFLLNVCFIWMNGE